MGGVCFRVFKCCLKPMTPGLPGVQRGHAPARYKVEVAGKGWKILVEELSSNAFLSDATHITVLWVEPGAR